MKLNRRQFLKVLGISSTVALVDPLKVIEAGARTRFPRRKSYNFTPGEYYRYAININKPVSVWTESERRKFVSILDNWLRNKIHPDYLDFNQVEYVFQDCYWELRGMAALGYHVPRKPVDRRTKPSKGYNLRA